MSIYSREFNLDREIAILSTMRGDVYNFRLGMICHETDYSPQYFSERVRRFREIYH